jgi:hypothetical protein
MAPDTTLEQHLVKMGRGYVCVSRRTQTSALKDGFPRLLLLLVWDPWCPGSIEEIRVEWLCCGQSCVAQPLRLCGLGNPSSGEVGVKVPREGTSLPSWEKIEGLQPGGPRDWPSI